MNIAIIGRTEILYSTVELLHRSGHRISCIITAKEAPEYSKNQENFKQLASKLKVPYASTASIMNEFEILAQTNSDIAVSVNYTGIIPEKVIKLFPLGILNAHGGDLPRYRGNACQAWAIINGEKKIGLCIHRMIGGELDRGDIIDREYYKLIRDTRIGEVYKWMSERIPELFLEAIQRLEYDPDFILESQSKNPADALRCYPRRPEDGKINWNMSAEQITRLVNASSEPYSGAYTTLDEEKCVIWRAEIFEDNEHWCGIPGQVSSINHNSETVTVLTGEGKVRITEIEYKGKRIPPSNIIKSIRSRFV